MFTFFSYVRKSSRIPSLGGYVELELSKSRTPTQVTSRTRARIRWTIERPRSPRHPSGHLLLAGSRERFGSSATKRVRSFGGRKVTSELSTGECHLQVIGGIQEDFRTEEKGGRKQSYHHVTRMFVYPLYNKIFILHELTLVSY